MESIFSDIILGFLWCVPWRWGYTFICTFIIRFSDVKARNIWWKFEITKNCTSFPERLNIWLIFFFLNIWFWNVWWNGHLDFFTENVRIYLIKQKALWIFKGQIRIHIISKFTHKSLDLIFITMIFIIHTF